MKIVIAGGGKVGEAICIDLAAEKHDVYVIDKDPRVVDRMMSIADVAAIAGNAASMDIQREVGVQDCDVFLAVTALDELNIIASIIANKLGAKFTVARVRNPEYSSNLDFVQGSLGISMMVNPELEAARSVALSIRFPSALGIETFANGRVQMVGVRVSEHSTLVGMQLSRFREIYGTVLICVIERGKDVFIPEGRTVLMGGDVIHVTGSIKELSSLYKNAGCFTGKIHSAMIVGGGRITKYLLQIISRQGLDVCVIESDEAEAEKMAAEFPNVKVVVGDGTDHSLLDEQRIDVYDCFVALTGNDEENLLTSLYATTKKVPKTVTKVNRTSLVGVLRDMGLQTIVTPKRLVSDNIIRFVRGLNDTLDSKVEAMYRIIDGRVEALEFEILNESRATGVPLKDLKLKKNILISYIVREGRLIFPTGNDEIRPGDHLIAVTTERDFFEVDNLLAGDGEERA